MSGRVGRFAFLGGGILLVVLAGALGDRTRIANTIYVGLGACLLALPAGAITASLISRTDLPGRRLFGLLLLGMLFVPLYLQAAAWDGGFGRLGWLTFSRGDPSKPLLTGWLAVIWIHGLQAIPWVVLLVGLALRQVEPAIEKQAMLDGSMGQVFWRVTFFRAWPALVMAGFFVFLNVATDMTVTDLYAVETIPRSLYSGFALGDSLATAWWNATPLLLAFSLCLVWGLATAVDRNPRPRVSRLDAPQFRLGAWRWAGFLLVLILILVVVGVPMANLFYKAGQVVVAGENGGRPVRTWSPGSLGERLYLTQFKFLNENLWTLLIGVMSAVAATVAGLLLAEWMDRRGFRGRVVVLLIGFMLAVPGPLLGLTLVSLFGLSDADWLYWLVHRTVFAPVVAMALRALPIATLLVWHHLRMVPAQAKEHAALAGASRWRIRRWIVLPQIARGVAVAFLVAYLVAAGDVAASVLVVPAGVSTTSIRVFGMLHAGVTDEVASLCVSHFLGFIVIGLFISLLMRDSRSSMR